MLKQCISTVLSLYTSICKVTKQVPELPWSRTAQILGDSEN